MTNLGSLNPRPPEWEVAVKAMNGRGQVVGESGSYIEMRAFLWEKGKMTALGDGFELSLLISDRWIGAINDRGQIPGVGGRWAYVWENGVTRSLPRVKGLWSSAAIDINESGAAAGACNFKPAGPLHPCLWRGGKLLDLGLAYGDRGRALALNDSGQVIGFSQAGRTRTGQAGKYHAFVWEEGKMTDLGTLGGKASQAFAINNHGQIIGWADTKSGASHAVLWTLKR